MSHSSRLRKFTRLIIAVWLLASSCEAALTFETHEIKQTVDSSDGKASAIFRFKNSGTTTVIIKAVQPGCGCTTAALAREIYLPGETGEINVVFNFEGRVGPQEKMIQVTTDEESNQHIPLILRVEITEPLKCSSHLLLWRIGGELEDKESVITPLPPRKITAISVQPASPAGVTAHIESLGSEGKYRLVVRPVDATKAINVAIACLATFGDGTTHSFTVFALMR